MHVLPKEVKFRKEIHMAGRVSLETIRNTLRKLDPTMDAEAFKTGQVLLAGRYFGLDVEAIAKFTKFPLDFVRNAVDRIVAANLVVNGKIVGTGWTNRTLGPKAMLYDLYTVLGKVKPITGKLGVAHRGIGWHAKGRATVSRAA
jgi:hypothetical protein